MKIKQSFKLLNQFSCMRAIRKRGLETFCDLEGLVDYAFQANHQVIKPGQVKEEILRLLQFLRPLRIKTMLEIGTSRTGGTLFLFSRIVSDDAHIISVDLPGGIHGGGYGLDKIPLFKSFRRARQKLDLIRGDSHNPETLRKVECLLEGKKLDFLFIDGDHSYEGVRSDFEMYRVLVRKGGIITFHDINLPDSKQESWGVNKFWQELKRRYPDAREFIHKYWMDWCEHKGKYEPKVVDGISRQGPGIGVIEC